MKYELDQIVFYIADNKICGAPILARMYVDNLHEDFAHTKEQRELFTPFGLSGVFYATCHGIIQEDNVFASKSELLDSIK